MSDTFALALRRAGLSPATASLYVRSLAGYRRQAEQLGVDLARPSIEGLDELVALVPNTRSSRQLLRATLSRWWDHLGEENLSRAIPVPSKPRMRCRALDEAPALRLEASAKTFGHPEGLAVLLGLYGALRRAEIASLRWDQIDGPWLVVVGKGNVTGTIPLHPVVVHALSHAPRQPGAVFVFPGASGRGHASPATVWNYVRRVAEAARIGPVTVHQLRHTALSTALDRSKDLRAVQELARHARPETTAGYTRVTSRRLLAVVEAIDYHAAAEEAERERGIA